MNEDSKRKRYNKLFLDRSTTTPLVAMQTWRRWQNYSKGNCNNHKSKEMISYFEKDHVESSESEATTSYNNISKEMLVSEVNDTTTIYDGCNTHDDGKIHSIDKDLFQNRCMEEEIEDNSVHQIYHDTTITNDENVKHDNTIMFASSKTTVDEVVQMIHSYCVRFNCSDEARLALFNMASVWAGSKFCNFMNSKYMISKRLDPPEEIFQYIFYCSKCNCLLDTFQRKDLLKTTYRHCKKCQEKYKMKTNLSNCFVSIDVKYQLQVLLQNSNVRKLLFQNIKNINNRLQNKNLNTIVDVYDGELYRRLYNNKHEKTVLLTFNFNLDGAPISKSSKSSMWPIQLIINELPIKVRFRNILLGGIWITNYEPCPQFMNLYINVFINQIRDLMTNGIVMNIENGKQCHFILQPLCSSVDSVARPIIQNRFQYNGYFGCSWCYQYGEYFNGAMRYCFMDDDPPLRDHESYIKDMKYVEKICKPFKGVKNFAEITKLENFDCVWGFPFDYMHGLLLGVVSTLWIKFWANNGKEDYNLSKNDKRNIEKRLLGIKMPSEIHRLPRSFNSGKWKASEWRSWLLYLSIPCLLGIIKPKYLSSFGLLVRCIHKLLSENIKIEDLRQCKIDLINFTVQCEEYYGKSVMNFNTHSLLHIVDNIYKSGPLPLTSTFPYENGIFVLKQKLTGPKGALLQMSKRLIQKTSLESELLSTCDNESSQYCKNILRNNHLISIETGLKTNSDVILFAEDKNVNENIQILKHYFDSTRLEDIKTFNKAVYKNITYTTSCYKRERKTDDRFFENLTNDIIEVIKIVLHKNICYILGYKYYVQFLSIENVIIDSFFKIISKSKDLHLFTFQDIKKKVVYINVENETYFCLMPNTYEIQ